MKILYSIDNKYSHCLAVSLVSLFDNNKKNDLDVSILTNDLSIDNEKKLSSIAKKYGRVLRIIRDNKIDSFLSSIGVRKYHDSYTPYYRIFFDRYFEGVDNILYLDADTIIVGDINSLQAIDLKDDYLAAVKEPQGRYYGNLIGLNNCDYFNSGVMLLNIRKWKKDNCRANVIENIKNKNFYVYPDQDIVNILFKEKIAVLSPEYNHMPIHRICSLNCYSAVFGLDDYYSMDDLVKAKQSPIIIHSYSFLGEFPWTKNNNHPDRELFSYYLAKTTYASLLSVKSKFNMFYFIEKRLMKILPENIFFNMYKNISIRFLNKRIHEYKKELKKV